MGESQRYDTIVIGAGMSGLAAGIRLAQYDQSVCVLDRHYLWGGLNSFYKLGGKRFDVGLHALTNYVPRGTPGRPLTRVLRQLRIPYEALKLAPQIESQSVFPDVSLRFSNDEQLLREEVAAAFPAELDGFDRLAREMSENGYDLDAPGVTAREALAEYVRDPQLVDLLLLPILFYGSPTPGDIGWSSFGVLWKSLYEEGFARPEGGIRPLLDLMRRRFLDVGGTLRMRSGVSAVQHDAGGVRGVTLDDGTELEADRVLSSAGWIETMRLCGDELDSAHGGSSRAGRITFVESSSILDTSPAALGFDTTITFFNTEERLVYEEPAEPVAYTSGVVCCPTNYRGDDSSQDECMRLTLMANYDRWAELPDERYYPLKDEVWERGMGQITDFAPDVRPHTVFKDVFTPRTIERFTGHCNGAVYGAPEKRPSGETPVPGLFVCGTDQGFLGIVGAMLSGISVANRHALVPA